MVKRFLTQNTCSTPLFRQSVVFLEPPSPGKHDLRLTTSVLNPTTPSYNHAAEVVYHLDVK